MKIDDVMEEIAEALRDIPGLSVHPHPVNTLVPPAAEVLYPDVEFDQAFARGLDRMEGGIIVSVSRVVDRAAREAISKYASGDDSPESVRAALHKHEWKTCAFARVVRGFGVDHSVGDVPYVAYRFDLDIYGSGS